MANGTPDLARLLGDDPAGLSTTGLLSALQGLSAMGNQPLIPADNPLLQLGAVLSGFSSGMQGRPNPVVEQMQQQRDRALQGGRLQLETMVHLANAQRQAAREKRAASEKVADVAKGVLTDSAAQNDPVGFETAYTALSKVYPGLYPQRTSEQIKQLATDRFTRETWKTDMKGMVSTAAAAAASGQTQAPPMYRGRPLPQDVWLSFQTGDKAGQLGLIQQAGFKSTDEALGNSLEQRKIAAETAIAERKVLAQSRMDTGQATPEDFLLLKQPLSNEQAANMARGMRAMGLPVPPALAEAETRDKELHTLKVTFEKGREKLQKEQTERLRELTKTLKDKGADVDTLIRALGAARKYADDLITLAVTMDWDEVTIKQQQRQANDLVTGLTQRLGQALEQKRLQTGPLNPPPPQNAEQRLRQKHFGPAPSPGQ